MPREIAPVKERSLGFKYGVDVFGLNKDYLN